MADAQAPVGPEAAQAVVSLHQQAKEHMRSARHHRRRARSLYAQAETLALQCKAHGIRIDIEIPTRTTPSPNLQGETSGNGHTPQADRS